MGTRYTTDDIETRADWNAVLDEGSGAVDAEGNLLGCCNMPGCPVPTWEWEYKTATLTGGYTYTGISISPAPTDCSALYSKFGQWDQVYFYSILEELPPANGGFSETARLRRYSAVMTQRKNRDPFTLVSEVITYHGGGTFRTEDWSTEEISPGVHAWKATPDGFDQYLVTALPDNSGWQWDFTNSFGDSDSGTFTLGNPSNLPGQLNSVYDLSGVTIDDTPVSVAWVGTECNTVLAEATITDSLLEEWTAAFLESEAEPYLDAKAWTSTGATKHDAARTVTHPTTTGGCTDEDHVATWTEKRVRYRATVSEDRTDINGTVSVGTGTEFDLLWNEIKDLGGDDILFAVEFEWTAPADTTDDWHEMQMGDQEYGTKTVGDVRFTCYTSRYGNAPDLDATFAISTGTTPPFAGLNQAGNTQTIPAL